MLLAIAFLIMGENYEAIRFLLSVKPGLSGRYTIAKAISSTAPYRAHLATFRDEPKAFRVGIEQ